jgi:hypothetical protein
LEVLRRSREASLIFSSIFKELLKQAATPLQILALFWQKSCSHSQLRAIGALKKGSEM